MGAMTTPDFEIPLLAALHRADVLREEWRRRYRRGGISPTHRIDPVDGMLVEFCAQIFPTTAGEGVDVVLGQWPKSDTRLSTTSLCLFTSQSASTVITTSQGIAQITETTYSGYSRIAMSNATWGALGAGTGGGRQTSYPQQTFGTVGVTGATINGFFIADNPPTKVVAQANFDDLTAVVLNTGDVLKLTPTVRFASA